VSGLEWQGVAAARRWTEICWQEITTPSQGCLDMRPWKALCPGRGPEREAEGVAGGGLRGGARLQLQTRCGARQGCGPAGSSGSKAAGWARLGLPVGETVNEGRGDAGVSSPLRVRSRVTQVVA
jgi:hypothetical protein